MNTEEILSQIDQEIALLTKAKNLLSGTETKKGPARPRSDGSSAPIATKRIKRRKMSAEARARIAAAQRTRWAKAKAKKA